MLEHPCPDRRRFAGALCQGTDSTRSPAVRIASCREGDGVDHVVDDVGFRGLPRGLRTRVHHRAARDPGLARWDLTVMQRSAGLPSASHREAPIVFEIIWGRCGINRVASSTGARERARSPRCPGLPCARSHLPAAPIRDAENGRGCGCARASATHLSPPVRPAQVPCLKWAPTTAAWPGPEADDACLVADGMRAVTAHAPGQSIPNAGSHP